MDYAQSSLVRAAELQGYNFPLLLHRIEVARVASWSTFRFAGVLNVEVVSTLR
jgi:hypothetical protein